MKKNASFFPVFLGKEQGRIVPGCPGIGVLANSFAIICTNFVLKSIQPELKMSIGCSSERWVQVANLNLRSAPNNYRERQD